MKNRKPQRSSRAERSRNEVGSWLALARVLQDGGDLEGAADACDRAIESRPACAEAHGARAAIDLKRGDLARALASSETALRLGRSAPAADHHITRGRVLGELGRHDEAVAALSAAVALDPGNPDAYTGLGLVLTDQGLFLEAFAAYQKTLARRPKDVQAYNNLAAVLVSLRQLDLAIATARIAVALAPDHPEVYLNLATALRLRGDDEDALAAYQRIVALKPDHGEALVELCHRRQHACDWDGLDALHDASFAHSYRKGRLVSPFSIMTATGSPLEQLLCARVWGERLAAMAPAPAEPRLVPAGPGRRLKLGYLSADFHNHATAMLIADLIEQHDRSRFEVFGYSLGPDDGSAMRRRLSGGFDHFIDLRHVRDAAAADRIREDGIDILLDLKGYTQDARVKIMAYRAAPIQVNYLAFPGTMGAQFIDYIVADAHVAPMSHAAFYDEKIVHLPHCYQPNDRMRAIAAETPTRQAQGLPDDAFVFCSFNNSYKITPAIFDVWMRLLRETPGAVLWLLESNRQVAANLRREAVRRGIAAERLVFAPFVAADRHLARLALADLFLDTSPVNAHTTASEALWAGLPILTLVGDAFASRVAGSLLMAAGLPELVTASLADYAATALSLARDGGRLSGLRERLQSNRSTMPLFDTPRYARTFEKALIHMADRHNGGQAPAAFAIADDA